MNKELFNPGYYSEKDLSCAGFKKLGRNVQIAKNNTIIGVENIEIGDNVRIDGGCAIIAAGSGWVKLGSYIHIGGWCYIGASAGVDMEDFSGLSQGVKLYTKSDDYSGEHMTNPMVPEEFTGCEQGSVRLGRHAIVGSGSVILPGVVLGDGVAVGALSFVTRSLDSWGIYSGIPARRIKERSKRLLEFEGKFLCNSSKANCSDLVP